MSNKLLLIDLIIHNKAINRLILLKHFKSK